MAKNIAASNVKKEIKASQAVSHDFIKVISMILHFQKKDLGLKLTGDQRIERKFDINNTNAIRQSEMKNFKVANVEELEMLNQKDASKWPKYVVMHKKMRKIEQETRI